MKHTDPASWIETSQDKTICNIGDHCCDAIRTIITAVEGQD